MKVYINNQLVSEITSIELLQKTIEDLRLNSLKEQSIVQVYVNGQYVDSLEEVNSIIENVEILVRQPEEIWVESLLESVHYLPNLIKALHQSVLNLRGANQSAGLDLFQQSLDGLIWTSQVLSSTQDFLGGYSDQTFGNIFTQISGRYASTLKEILIAWEHTDHVLLTDITEYDLIPLIEELHQLFVQVIEALKTAS